MKNKKHQHSTFTKSKFLDFSVFIMVSALSLLVVYMTVPKTIDIFTLVIFVGILVPTIVALVSGAPFVPTPMRAVEKMLNTAGVKKDQNVIDIGCGDGRLCYKASKKGAKATGYELSPVVYVLAKIRQFFWRSKAKIKFGDFRMHNLSEADHIVTYMLPETLIKFIPKFEKDLKNGARVTSYAFRIGNWVPVHVEPSCSKENISKIWVYEIGKHKAE